MHHEDSRSSPRTRPTFAMCHIPGTSAQPEEIAGETEAREPRNTRWITVPCACAYTRATGVRAHTGSHVHPGMLWAQTNRHPPTSAPTEGGTRVMEEGKKQPQHPLVTVSNGLMSAHRASLLWEWPGKGMEQHSWSDAETP